MVLKQGADPAEFERLAVEEILPAFNRVPGLEARLLRGDRGEREGKDAFMLTLDSVERRDGYFPIRGEGFSEEFGGYMSDIGPRMERFISLLACFPDPMHTDYVVSGE